MSYRKLRDTWSLYRSCDIPIMIYYGQNISSWVHQKENYSGPVTISFAEWQQYLQNGDNIIQGSGGVIPGGTSQTPGGNSGAVYRGTVRQGMGY